MVDYTLQDLGDYIAANGTQISPLIERGSDGIPTAVPTLTNSDIRQISAADRGELLRYISQMGIVNTPDKMLEQQAAFLARYNIFPGDPRYEIEMERLATSQSGRLLLEQVRRAGERYETLSAIDGDTSTPMLYLAEGSNPCPECEALDGTEGTYAELMANDQVPGARCLGGDACQCALIPFR